MASATVATAVKTKSRRPTLSQNVSGLASVYLNEFIQITHEYKKNDKMLINIYEKTYQIEDRNQLQEIFTLYLTNDDVVDPISKWCDEHLKVSE